MKLQKSKYKLSPNEEARLLKEEKERRKILRLKQVRSSETHHVKLYIRDNMWKGYIV